MLNIFDPGAVNSHAAMYQAWVVPDAFPEERQPVVRNWHPEDLVAYCGGSYATVAYSK